MSIPTIQLRCPPEFEGLAGVAEVFPGCNCRPYLLSKGAVQAKVKTCLKRAITENAVILVRPSPESEIVNIPKQATTILKCSEQ